MRSKQLIQLIKDVIPYDNCDLKYEFDTYDSVNLRLHDGGYISIGIDPPTQKCPVSFLFFNTNESDFRINGQNEYNGKLNYFGDNPEKELIRL